MITPLDIQNKEFTRGVRGYKEEEVDEFLDLVTVDLEKVLAENAALKAQIESMGKDIDKYKTSENAVLETLEAAKALMGDIGTSAEKRAQILLKNAELDAELIQREAKESMERLTDETLKMKSRFIEFRSKYKALLESELTRFDTLSTELFEDLDPADFADTVLLKADYAAAVNNAAEGTAEMAKTRVNAKKIED